MEETLEKGLARIFGNGANQQQTPTQPGQPAQPTPTPAQNQTTDAANDEDLNAAGDAYDAAIEAQRNGDWAKYGEEIKRLGEILERLQQ